MLASAHSSRVGFVFAGDRKVLKQFTSFPLSHSQKIKNQTNKTSESNQDRLLKHSGRIQNGKTHKS